jgi:hypothetical protein
LKDDENICSQKLVFKIFKAHLINLLNVRDNVDTSAINTLKIKDLEEK